MERTSVVGVSRPALDAGEKVRGRTVYLADLEMPGVAHAKVLRSPFAHARLVSIDASAARALPGVVCVLTRDEVLADAEMETHYGYVFRDVPLVALDKVRHQGDIVAVVVAEDASTADEALELVDVEYAELPAVTSTSEALAEGAPLVHEVMLPVAPELRPKEGTNICHEVSLRHGDVEQGFREADEVFEDTYSVPPVQHCALELHGFICSYEESQITVWTNCQSPFPLQGELERIFKRPARVIVPHVGGGFGSKSRDRLEAVANGGLQAGSPPRPAHPEPGRDLPDVHPPRADVLDQDGREAGRHDCGPALPIRNRRGSIQHQRGAQRQQHAEGGDGALPHPQRAG